MAQAQPPTIPTRVKAPEGLICFANVWQPRPNKDPSKPAKYGVTILWPKGTDLTILKNAAKAAVEKKFGDKPPPNLRSPFRDGDVVRPDDPVFKNKIFVSARSKDKPGVVDRGVHAITNEMDFYSGCTALVTINAFYYEHEGNKGVSFALGNIQKVADGTRLTGQRTADEDFEDMGSEPGGVDALF